MANEQPQALPSTYQALFRPTSEEVPLELKTIDTPAVVPGSVLVKILYAWIPHYALEILSNRNGKRGNFSAPRNPYVAGFTAVARVAAVPIDAVVLKVGDLVVVEPTVYARDDPLNTKFLQGWAVGMTPSCIRFADVWPTGAFAEMMLAPLESVHRVDEAALKKQGVSLEDLAFFGQFGTAYGGLRSVNIRAGETVLIAPATGTFGGAAVQVAIAMGANVIAVGRRKDVLDEIAAANPGRVEVFQLEDDGTLDAMASVEKFGEVDVFCDFTPAAAASNGLTKSGIYATRAGGRICLVGGVPGDVAIPYGAAMWKCLTIQGSIMIQPEQTKELVKLVETGRLVLGEKAGFKNCGMFALRDWKAALESAETESGPRKGTFFAPASVL